MILGVERGTVLLIDYDKAWKKYFEIEKNNLIRIFEDNIIDIQHVGGTAIPQLKSKPIIDIAVLVPSLGCVIKECAELAKQHYTEREGRLEGRQKVFAKTTGTLVTHHLHLIEQGEKDWDDKIRFRDLLRGNLALTNEYADLKAKLYTSFKNNRLAYTVGKNNFIQKVLNIS